MAVDRPMLRPAGRIGVGLGIRNIDGMAGIDSGIIWAQEFSLILSETALPRATTVLFLPTGLGPL